jgi:hypothetical protein
MRRASKIEVAACPTGKMSYQPGCKNITTTIRTTLQSLVTAMATISGRNRSAASFYKHHDRWASLLIHPNGLQLLKYYTVKLQDNSTSALAAELQKLLLTDSDIDVWTKKETEISSKLRISLQKLSFGSDISITGERNEEVEGTLNGERVSGRPEIVIRMGGSVVMIMEVSVDNNGGEMKAGQAFDYASLIDNDSPQKRQTILLLTLHVDRKQEECAPEITLEAFLYLHSVNEAERKLCFLWREVYPLESVCGGLVRCLDCAEHLCTLDTPNNWNVVSDNVAIENDHSVYKIFDNRFHPTYGKPDAWMSDQPWLKSLNVDSEFLLFKESPSVDRLGHPSESGDSPETVPYPKGSVRIIKYKYVHGTHFASKVSHFQAIAKRIKEMHEAGIVHGDVRGFNMLHPLPESSDATGEQQTIRESLLIDFDLCGSEEDKYPPGYSERVIENEYHRAGKANQKMKKEHDWYDLASAMAPYCISGFPSDPPNMAWSALCVHFRAKNPLIDPSTDADTFLMLIDNFITLHGDISIWISEGRTLDWKEELKGTGSPNN